MGNSAQGSQAAGAPGGTRGANQPLVLIFERDESLAASLLGQFRAQGYEGRSARTPVEVFNDIARYPVALVLVNLGQAATSRREFWVALDAQRRGRGVQVVTYRVIVPGVEPESPDGSGRGALADVEIRGAQGYSALIEAVRLRLPLPRQTPDSSFLVGSGPLSRAMNGQSGPVPFSGPSGLSPDSHAPDYGARPQIAGVLNMNAGTPPGQLPEFAPLSGVPGAPLNTPVNGGWMPEPTPLLSTQGGQAFPAPLDQHHQQWPGAYLAPPAMPPQQMNAPDRPASSMRPEPPGVMDMNGAGAMTMQPGGPAEMDDLRRASLSPAMPMGELAALSDAIHALAAAGAPGYRSAAAAVSAMNAASMAGNPINPASMPANTMNAASMAANQMNGASSQDMSWLGSRGASSVNPFAPSPGTREESPPSSPMGGINPMGNGNQPPARGAAETLYMSQQAFADMRPLADSSQDTRSRSLSGSVEEAESLRRERTTPSWSRLNNEPAPDSRRLSGQAGLTSASESANAYQPQTLSPVVAPGRVERSLSNVLIEGQLVSQQRLEVALGIQRLLRGVDIDYRLGELLLMFKFLTSDQLLAALLVSRGLVTPAQVASMGRIKQELHAIGMEYDLENLLILFRLLSSEQLREIRSEFP